VRTIERARVRARARGIERTRDSEREKGGGGGETEKGIGERQSILVSEHTRNTQNEGAMVIPTMQRRFLQPCNAFQATAVNYCDNNAPRRLTSRLARGDRTLRSRASVMSAY
jgi:hypothetical protein